MKAKMTRRILALVLSVVMVLAIIPAAFASNFPDVPDGKWYTEAIDYCFDKGLMSGTGEGFDPMGYVTREMAVQTLYAMTGSPATEYEAKFTDVPAGKWYTPAIMWGSKNKIVNGYDTGAFGVTDLVTREQVAMFFYNYANFVGLNEDFASLNAFPDKDDVHSWAKTAVQWAVAMGVLSGKAIDGVNYLKPQDPLMRAELASILARFHEKYIDFEICNHEETEIRNAKPATCTEEGYTGDTYCLNPDCHLKGEAIKKGEVIPALGHDFVDGFCSRCGEPDPDCGRTFTLADEVFGGAQIIIYSPGHGMVVTNETDNDWYLVPEERTPDGDAFIEEDFGDFDNFVWDVVDNGDGTVSFVNGDNMIAAWVSGTYIELTNKADYEGADTKWIVTFVDGLAYIQSATLSNSYGPAYIECYYNANKDKTNISGYTSGDPTAKSNDFGFQIYVSGRICTHEWDDGVVTAPTCTEDGYTLFTCSICGATKKDNIVPAAGHNYVDGVCTVCGAKEKVFTLSEELADDMQVVIYNPGHGMAIKNENDNNWYLVPEVITPDGDKIVSPDDSIVWTVVDNGDGTISFVNGDNAIAAWLSVQGDKSYIELTNDANYDGADTKWIVTFIDGLGYIQSSSLSNSYGPAYIECFYNANKDKTNISGYTSSNPSSKSGDFGFQFYVLGNPCEHDWVAGTPVAATCTEDGYTPYTCSKCNAAKKGDIVPATGHIDEDENGKCDVCDADLNNLFVLTNTLEDGDQVIIVNAANNIALGADYGSSFYNPGVAVSPVDGKIDNTDETIVWTVGKDGDKYTFSYGGQKLAMGASYSSMPLGEVNDTWEIRESNTENAYYIFNVGREVYVEWYAEKEYWSGYYNNSNEALFAHSFYVKGNPCEHDWVAGTPVAATCLDDGYTPYTCSKCNAVKTGDVVPALGHDFGDDNICDVCGYEKPELGDSVAIFYPTDNKVMTTESYFYNNKKYELAAADATLTDGIISTEADNVALFTMIEDGETVTFKTEDGKYLSADGTNVALVDAEDDNTKFVLEEADGGVYIRCATAQYQDKAQYLEYYSNYFTVYSFQEAKANIYTFVLAPVAEPCAHDWVAGTVVEATCTKAGYTEYTCSLCGATKQDDVVEALGHDYVDGVCSRCGDEEKTDGSYVLVTDAADLADGDVFVFGATKDGTTYGSGDISGKFLGSVTATLTDGVLSGDGLVEITLEETTGGWYLKIGDKYINTTAAKALTFGNTASTVWTISIADGLATVAAGDYGRFLYNVSSPRFLNYTSATNASMLLPSIYKAA